MAREPVDERLGHVLDHREAARGVAVQGRVADRELRLVAGREHEPAELVRQRHEQVAADAGLEVLLGDVRIAAVEAARQGLLVGLHRRADLQVAGLEAEVGRQGARVGLGLGRGMRRGHHRHVHALGSQRVGGDAGDQRGVDPAGETEHHVSEPVLLHVIAQADRQRRVDLGLGIELGGEALRRRRAVGPRRERHRRQLVDAAAAAARGGAVAGVA